MNVMNYYALPDEKLEEKIDEIRWWLFYHPDDERFSTALFALHVALNALEIRDNGDDALENIIDRIV